MSDDVSERIGDLASAGRFTVLAIDHGPSLVSRLASAGGTEPVDPLAAKLAVVETLAHSCSAVLADMTLAATAEFQRAMALAQFSLILSVDGADYDSSEELPPRVPTEDEVGWLVAAGASAAKVVLYYNRTESDAALRRRRISDISSACSSVGLPLIVEPLPQGGMPLDTWDVAAVASEMAGCGAAILKLPLPDGTPVEMDTTAERITDELGSVPWILLSFGNALPVFLAKLELAMRHGCAGFAAGRSLWEALVSRPSDASTRRDARVRLDQALAVVARYARAESTRGVPGDDHASRGGLSR